MDPIQEKFLPMATHSQQRKADLREVPKLRKVTNGGSESIAHARGCQSSEPDQDLEPQEPTKAPHERNSAILVP